MVTMVVEVGEKRYHLRIFDDVNCGRAGALV
jgi:hypothetical protein